MNYGRNDAIGMGDEELRCRELACDFAARDIACTLDEALLAAMIKAARDEARDEYESQPTSQDCSDECPCPCHGCECECPCHG